MSPGIHVHCNTSAICSNKQSDSNYITPASQPGTIYNERSIPYTRQEFFFHLIDRTNNESISCNHAQNYTFCICTFLKTEECEGEELPYMYGLLTYYSMEQSPSGEANQSLQLVKKFPAFLWNTKVLYRTHKARHLSLS
jgi:hypothetical protein